MTSEAIADATYLNALVARSRGERRPDLVKLLEQRALFVVDCTGDGLRTVVVRSQDLDGEAEDLVYRFRLAEFLRIGLMDVGLARREAMQREPLDGSSVHALTFDAGGRLLGYLALVGSYDPVPLALDDPGRALFPVEVAHHVDLVSRFATPALDTHGVHEIKRFVRAGGIPPGTLRDRVPWHLILGLGRTVVALRNADLLIGDSREGGALRHFRLLGFDPLVLQDTVPSLPRTALMWPSYELETTARPFAGLLPDDVPERLDQIEASLARHVEEQDWQKRVILELRGRVPA